MRSAVRELLAIEGECCARQALLMSFGNITLVAGGQRIMAALVSTALQLSNSYRTVAEERPRSNAIAAAGRDAAGIDPH